MIALYNYNNIIDKHGTANQINAVLYTDDSML